MRIDLAGWSFGDVVPRYQNLAASVTELILPGFGISAKASRGFIAASAASANFAGVPLTDAQGGQAQIPQSTVAFNVAFGGGHFADTQYPGAQWSLAAGYAVATQAACNAGIPPCYSSRYGQVTASVSLVGGEGFLNFALGPANVAVHPGAISQNQDAATTSQFGDFLNKNTWNGSAGYHVLNDLKTGVCNSIVLSASNTAAAPDIVAEVPGTAVSLAAYAEIVPLRSYIPIVGFIGVAHQIQNINMMSSLLNAASLGNQPVSTVTYALSISIGTEHYRNALRTPLVDEADTDLRGLNGAESPEGDPTRTWRRRLSVRGGERRKRNPAWPIVAVLLAPLVVPSTGRPLPRGVIVDPPHTTPTERTLARGLLGGRARCPVRRRW